MAENGAKRKAFPVEPEFVRQAELIRESDEPPSDGAYSRTTFYRLKREGRFKYVREDPPGRFWIGVDPATGIPVWNGPAPRSGRPGIKVRQREQRVEPEAREMSREYRELSRLLRLPKSLRPWDEEPPYVRMRHEYLRRKLRRPKSERRLPTQHAEWPAWVPDLHGWSPLRPATWPWELRRMLIRDGEEVQKVKTDKGAWAVPRGYEADAEP